MTRLTITMVFLTVITAAIACDGHTENTQEGKKMTTNNINPHDIRPSALAGTWYEAEPKELQATISHYLENAKVSQGLGRIVGIIVPHAGYRYSGPVAAYAYRQIKGKSYDTIVVIAPNHADPRLRFSSVYTRGAYTTPLGQVPVDTETAQAIVDFSSTDDVQASDLGHLSDYGGRMEHSVEIQLPFLQTVVGSFKLVPIVMGNHDSVSATALGKAVASAVKGKNALIVASSDLSHFHDGATAKKLDSVVRGYVESYNPDGLLNALSSGKCEACGGAPIAAVMMACRELGATQATVLFMADSGDVTGDNSSVVGYMSAALTVPGDTGGEVKVGVDLGLTESEKDVLRGVVKQTLDSVVNGGQVPRNLDRNGKLGERWGAFVTLTKDGMLRGCIGHIIGTQPLIDTVAEMAKAAALEDPRFPPVKPDELPRIEFEISVLTPIRKITDINEIQVGRDGIIISRGYNRGLLLPQVATEYGWDRKTFLEHTCLKAGLPKDAWKESGTVIEMFSAEVFK
ncbi:AmmeMemoRadiSam system protein B [bacterium]|nr:AmmeMemoRadiSam system protein B [bacterium]